MNPGTIALTIITVYVILNLIAAAFCAVSSERDTVTRDEQPERRRPAA